MLRTIINFAADRLGRTMSPEDGRRYAGQCLLAWKSHVDRGSPYGFAAHLYGVSVGDVAALDLLQKNHQDELQSALPMIGAGRLTFGTLLKRIGTGQEITIAGKVRPYRDRGRAVEYLFGDRR